MDGKGPSICLLEQAWPLRSGVSFSEAYSMAKELPVPRVWFLDAVPFFVVVLIAVHVLALVSSPSSIPIYFSQAFQQTPLISFSIHLFSGLLDLQVSYRKTTTSAKESALTKKTQQCN